LAHQVRFGLFQRPGGGALRKIISQDLFRRLGGFLLLSGDLSLCGAEDLAGDAQAGITLQEKVRQVGEPLEGFGKRGERIIRKIEVSELRELAQRVENGGELIVVKE
jgi:hypothetical protein